MRRGGRRAKRSVTRGGRRTERLVTRGRRRVERDFASRRTSRSRSGKGGHRDRAELGRGEPPAGSHCEADPVPDGRGTAGRRGPGRVSVEPQGEPVEFGVTGALGEPDPVDASLRVTRRVALRATASWRSVSSQAPWRASRSGRRRLRRRTASWTSPAPTGSRPWSPRQPRRARGPARRAPAASSATVRCPAAVRPSGAAGTPVTSTGSAATGT